MSTFDFEKKQASPEWLTSILVKNGFLSTGNVSSIKQETTLSESALLSTFFSLKVNYSQGSSGLLPSNILMKLIKPEFYDIGEKEADFYDVVINTKTPLPLPTCYGTEKSQESKQSCLLLENLTDTHYQLQGGLPPTQDQGKDVTTVLAKLHAYWWNHSKFKEPIFDLPENWGPKWIQEAEKCFPQFVDFVGDRLSEERKKRYERVFETFPKLFLSQFSSSKRRTLIHNDTHFGNFLFPRNKEGGQCVLIDWQEWVIGVGANDLAYTIALHCYTDYRQRMEQALLKGYLEEMQKQGINYAWNDLWADYRISVIFMLLVPVLRYATLNVPPPYWWPHLERGFAAFEDLNCLEFL